MTSRGGASTTWYPYNLPQTLTQAGGNASTFDYAPDRSRYRQTSVDGSTTEDRLYIGGLFEQLTSGASGTEFRHHIVVNGQTVAIRVVSASRDDTLYLHDDHLGSTDAITDEHGTLLIHESFDAWGRRRGSAWSGAPSSADLATIRSTTHRRFTGQEALDNLALVNLNGRVYDPTIARFLSADPYVQAPYASQSLNRYSYTFDNPLNATDPTGYCTGTLIQSAGPDLYPEKGPYDSSSGSFQQLNQQRNAMVGAIDKALDVWMRQSAQEDQNTMARQQLSNDHGPNASQGMRLLDAANATEPAHQSAQFVQQVLVSGRDDHGAQTRANLSVDDFVSLLERGYYERPGSILMPNGWRIVGPQVPAQRYCVGSDPIATQGYDATVDLLGDVVDAATLIVGFPEDESVAAAELVIEKLPDLRVLRPGERALLDRFPNLGSPKANWAQNSGVLRQEMSRARPIRDASADEAGRLINNTGFLRAERSLLQNRGWTYDPGTTMWYPPR